MTAKGKGIIIPPLEPDLRVNRLVVAIMKTDCLKEYFFDQNKVFLACTYLGIRPPIIHYIDDIILFLNSLYFEKTDKFQQFFEYILNEILEEEGYDPQYEFFEGYNRFSQELNILGYHYDVDQEKVIPVVGHAMGDVEIESELEKMLHKLNSEYPKMLKGAWETFLSESPDKYRQTIVSVRELLNQVLRQLAPEQETRRDRAKQIIKSDTEAELVNAVAEVIVKLSDTQSKIHERFNYEDTLFTLKITEYILYFLLMRIT